MGVYLNLLCNLGPAVHICKTGEQYLLVGSFIMQLYRNHVCVTLDLLLLIPELLIYSSIFCAVFGRYMLYFVSCYITCKYQNNYV